MMETIESREVKETLYTVATRNLDAVIAICQFPSDAFFLAEKLPSRVVIGEEERKELLRFTRLNAVLSNKDFSFAHFTSGRIFQKQRELRWEHSLEKPGEIQVVYSGIMDELPLLEDAVHQDLDTCRKSGRCYYLFGERLRPEQLDEIGVPAEEREGAFATLRIPRILNYPPLEGAEQVGLVMREYIDKATEHIIHFRFQDLEKVE